MIVGLLDATVFREEKELNDRCRFFHSRPRSTYWRYGRLEHVGRESETERYEREKF